MSNNSNNTVTRNQLIELIRENMVSLNHNISHYNQNIREYNNNIRTMLEMIQSVRPISNINLSTSPTTYYSSTMRRRPSIITSNVENDFTNILYQRFLNAFVSGLENGNNDSNGLTQEQINRFTQDILYTPDPNQTTCHICQEDFVENETVCQILSCRHIFHKSELMTWFERHNTCPVCRQDVLRPPTRQSSQRNNEQNTQTSSSSNTNSLQREQTQQTQQTQDNLQNQSTNELLDNFSNILTNLITNQTPELDSSGSLVYTFDVPIYNYLNRL